MTCTPLRLPGGATAIVCDRGRRTSKCKACEARGAPKLCDFPIAPGKTCDAKCCSSCAIHVAEDRDFCPNHKETTMVDFKAAMERAAARKAIPCPTCGAAAGADCVALGGRLDGWNIEFDEGDVVNLHHAARDPDVPTAEEEVGQTKQSTIRLKPKPAMELATDLGLKMADTLVLHVGHRSVDAAALSKATVALNNAICADRRAVVEWYRSNVRLLMQQLGVDEAKCRSCNAPIWWIVTKNDKKAPIDVDGLNHFGSCPHARMHRR